MDIPRLPLLALATAGLITGCGSSDSNSKSTSAAAPAAPAQTTPAAAAPAPGGPVTVDASEFKFAPAAITAKAGKVKVALDNKGDTEHEFVLLKTNQAAGALSVKGGRVSEAASVGEISETKAGQTATHTFHLKPGKYVYVCNIPGHYQQGMHGTLTVK